MPFEHDADRLHSYAARFVRRSVQQNLPRATRNKVQDLVRRADRVLSRTCGGGHKNRFAPSRVKLVVRARLQLSGSARCFGAAEACFEEVNNKCPGSVESAQKGAAIQPGATAEKACYAYI
jgi:hypothetical protein